jgi:hypothetical protein
MVLLRLEISSPDMENIFISFFPMERKKSLQTFYYFAILLLSLGIYLFTIYYLISFYYFLNIFYYLTTF